jgi:GTP 3',8-cyclase
VLADSFGRLATNLRVSVTDRCNLRCTYCMPAEGLEWLPGPALLTDDEVSRLVSVTVRRLGITEVRFTGASRLLPGAAAIIARTAALEPRPEISLTTNGIGLARLAQPLRAAGLDRLNVSLESVSPEVFKGWPGATGWPTYWPGWPVRSSAGDPGAVGGPY